MARDTVLSVRLPPAVYTALNEKARREGKSVSEVVRTLVALYISDDLPPQMQAAYAASQELVLKGLGAVKEAMQRHLRQLQTDVAKRVMEIAKDGTV